MVTLVPTKSIPFFIKFNDLIFREAKLDLLTLNSCDRVVATLELIRRTNIRVHYMKVQSKHVTLKNKRSILDDIEYCIKNSVS